MNNKVRHLLGISGGKDSASLAIYLHQRHPDLEVEYYTCDTGKELPETYELVEKLEIYLGKKITRLQASPDSHKNPFDHSLEDNGGFLPSSTARWCTKKLKLEPFERFVGNDPVISYVGIRGDEDRDGYISKKSNIQSIFPFRQNIWSEDVVKKVLANSNIKDLTELYEDVVSAEQLAQLLPIIEKPLSLKYNQKQKLNDLLERGTKDLNQVIFKYLKNTEYPLATVDEFPLIDNEDNLIRADIFRILEESGVGVPAYYNKKEFEIDGETGHYARSRSGCFFCFFQQKIEWVWLFENHLDEFLLAEKYEQNNGGVQFAWNQSETLRELIGVPADVPLCEVDETGNVVTKIYQEVLDKRDTSRTDDIKRYSLKKAKKNAHKNDSPFLLDILADAEGEGCASCFI